MNPTVEHLMKQLPVKSDDRPGRGGWEPGRYMNRCCHCRDQFWGDKHAVSCADCAYRKSDGS